MIEYVAGALLAVEILGAIAAAIIVFRAATSRWRHSHPRHHFLKSRLKLGTSGRLHAVDFGAFRSQPPCCNHARKYTAATASAIPRGNARRWPTFRARAGRIRCVQNRPVPGSPTVARWPRGPVVSRTLRPTDKLTPLLLRFMRRPGMMRTRRKKRRLMRMPPRLFRQLGLVREFFKLRKVTRRIRLALLKLSLLFVSFQVLTLDGTMAGSKRLSRLTISAACCKRLSHISQPKS